MNAAPRVGLWLALLALPFLSGSCSRESAPVIRTRSVVVLVLDGARQSEMWQDPTRAHIPHLSGDLAPLGRLMPGFKNNGPTYTTSGHTAISSGFYEDLDNTTGTQLPSHAGIFQHFLRATGLPKEKAWVIASKDKLRILGDTGEAGWQGQDMPSLWCGLQGSGPGYGEDGDTVAQAKQVLAAFHPDLVLINLKQPDAAGHTGVWSEYLHGLEASDAHAVDLWKTLQADPYYCGRTSLFIVHDHGRHLDGVATGFQDHGDGCAGCRQVALLAMGPEFSSGTVVDGGELIDLPVTIAALLGFPLPGAPGRNLLK